MPKLSLSNSFWDTRQNLIITLGAILSSKITNKQHGKMWHKIDYGKYTRLQYESWNKAGHCLIWSELRTSAGNMGISTLMLFFASTRMTVKALQVLIYVYVCVYVHVHKERGQIWPTVFGMITWVVNRNGVDLWVLVMLRDLKHWLHRMCVYFVKTKLCIVILNSIKQYWGLRIWVTNYPHSR